MIFIGLLRTKFSSWIPVLLHWSRIRWHKVSNKNFDYLLLFKTWPAVAILDCSYVADASRRFSGFQKLSIKRPGEHAPFASKTSRHSVYHDSRVKDLGVKANLKIFVALWSDEKLTAVVR